MKSFLDRLRRKSADARAQTTGTPTPTPEDPAVEKAAASVSAVAGEAAPNGPPPDPAQLLPPPPDTASGPSIELQIGDFLERIPSAVLKPGPIDRTLGLQFDLNAIASRFKRSDPRIRVSEIYRRQPAIFHRELAESSDATVLLPWQKIIDMVMTREGSASPLPAEILTALTQCLREPRPAPDDDDSPSTALIATPATQGQLRPAADASSPSWFSAKPMPSGALTTLPSTLRPPPTAGEALSLARSSVKPASACAAPQPSRPFASIVDHIAPPEIERAVVTKPSAPPPRRASEVLGEQLASITNHFARLVRQLEESTKAQVPAHAEHIPGIEHLMHLADQKLAQAANERDAVASLKAHLESQFEALTFVQGGVATLQETLEAQSREFGRMQQVLQNVEEQLATVTGERDALTAEKAQLTGQPASPAPVEKLSERESARDPNAREPQRPAPAPALAQRSAARAAAHRQARPATRFCRARPHVIHPPASAIGNAPDSHRAGIAGK